jgi:hypothetical protein
VTARAAGGGIARGAAVVAVLAAVVASAAWITVQQMQVRVLAQVMVGGRPSREVLVTGAEGPRALPVRTVVELVALVLAGAVLVLLVLARPRRHARRTGPAVAPDADVARSAPPVVDGTGDQAVEERERLVALCLWLLDAADRPAVRERLVRGLAAVGVQELDATGRRFDESWQEAVGPEPTGRDDLVGTVAATRRPGFADRGRLLRPASVTVYTRGGDG